MSTCWSMLEAYIGGGGGFRGMGAKHLGEVRKVQSRVQCASADTVVRANVCAHLPTPMRQLHRHHTDVDVMMPHRDHADINVMMRCDIDARCHREATDTNRRCSGVISAVTASSSER